MTRRMLFPLLLGLAGTAILLALGVWQLQRLEWKTSIIDRIESRMASDPVPLPADPDPARDAYLRVRASGTVGPEELHVYTAAPGGGAAYRIVAPLVLDDGRRILLDRGIVPVEAKDAARPATRTTVEGTLLWPEETDRFTAPPDPSENIWFARDATLMAEALGTLPVMLVAAATSDAGGPRPVPVGVNIRNNHLEYAVTWFGLAVVWSLMTGYLLWRIKRRID